MELKVVAHIRTDFKEKFGIPRQSGLAGDALGEIVFEKEYRTLDAIKGIEGFEYIWLLWDFSKARRDNFSATVKPPRLGGNKKMGVFATRSPFRPNNIGLSSVRLEKVIEESDEGPKLIVSGVDMLDGTPIYDIKPYIPYADAHVNVKAGWTDEADERELQVVFDEELLEILPENKRKPAIQILAGDPRPSYQDDEDRRYGVNFADYDIRFKVKDGVLTVVEVKRPGEH